MKNKIAIALLFMIAAFQTNAQTTFKPGVRAGVNFAHLAENENYNNGLYYSFDNNAGADNYDYKSLVDFYVGIYGAIRFSKLYTLQPELDYTRQGSTQEYVGPNNGIIPANFDLRYSYLSITAINKFSFKNFNVHVGPAIEVIIDRNAKAGDGSNNDLDFGLQAGIGYNFTENLGIEARAKTGFIPVQSFGRDLSNVVFSLGLTYTFDLK